MSIEKIHLRKLLRLFYARPSLQTTLLREDIRNGIKKDKRKKEGKKGTGGDFYVPFWADAKDHIAGKLDLRNQSEYRIEKNEGRGRLYNALTDGFLGVWEEKIRWRNEKFEFRAEITNSQLAISELNAIVKIENVLAVKIWDGSSRAVYPYFYEDPILPIDGVRLGFWALQQGLTDFNSDHLRILDVLRSSYYRPEDVRLQGDEREVFIQKYRAILKEWEKLRRDYP